MSLKALSAYRISYMRESSSVSGRTGAEESVSEWMLRAEEGKRIVAEDMFPLPQPAQDARWEK